MSLFININQLDALNFIISLFQASTYFEHMCWKHVEAWNKLIIKFSASSWFGTATYRCDGTRDCIIQFCPPDDEHMCWKHVEAWNKLIIKFSASSWLIFINKYIEMHGQQNIKKKHNCRLFGDEHNGTAAVRIVIVPSLIWRQKCFAYRV